MKPIDQNINSVGFRRYFENTSWLLLEKIVKIFIATFVSIALARYLGPSDFGKLNYAISITTILMVFVTFGSDEILVKELLSKKINENIIISSAVFFRLVGAIISFAMICIVSFFDESNKYIIVVVASSLIFQVFGVIESFLQSKVHSRKSSFLNIVLGLLSALIKIYLIYKNKSLIFFAYAYVLDAFTLFVGQFILLRREQVVFKFVNIKVSFIKNLFKQSWPLALGGLIISVYMRIDQIMIEHMYSSTEVGIYSAALRISEAWYFIPMVISASLFPAILNAKVNNNEIYLMRIQNLFSLITLLSLCFALPISFLSRDLVSLLYGAKYINSGSILVLHVWATVFVGFGVVSSKWYVAEGMQHLLLIRSICGLFANIALNYILIPQMGGVGAAIATLISQGISALLFDLFRTETRQLFYMKLKSFLFWKVSLRH